MPPAQTPPDPGAFTDDPGSFFTSMAAGYTPDEAERERAFYAHLLAGVGAAVSCGAVLGAIAPVIVYAIAKRRGPFLLYHVNHSLLFQALLLAVYFGLAAFGTVLSLVGACFGWVVLLLLPPVWLVTIVYPIVVALAVKRGQWAEYPWLGKKVLRDWPAILK